MNRQVAGAIGGLVGLSALVAWAIAGPEEKFGSRPPADRPALALLTSLPLIFGESFGLDDGGSPALTRLEQRYKVMPIGVADAASLKGHRLLLMAHPRAQPAEILVELDEWVRRGGRVLLLADPHLSWHSKRPLGDPLRPPPAFADTGLLLHWGLTLSGPRPDGPADASNGELNILVPRKRNGRGGCSIGNGGFVARCALGKGRATVIADADFLDADGDEARQGASEPNLDLLIDELASLESR